MSRLKFKKASDGSFEKVTQDMPQKEVQVCGNEEEKLAKKDFEIHHNEYHCVIRKGDSLKDIPVLYWENLKTEGVF